MLAPTFLYPGLGAADPAKECALFGVSIPGSAQEAKGLSRQQKPNTEQRGGTGQPSPSILDTYPFSVFPSHSGSPLNGGRVSRKRIFSHFGGGGHLYELKLPGPKPHLRIPTCWGAWNSLQNHLQVQGFLRPSGQGN